MYLEEAICYTIHRQTLDSVTAAAALANLIVRNERNIPNFRFHLCKASNARPDPIKPNPDQFSKFSKRTVDLGTRAYARGWFWG